MSQEKEAIIVADNKHTLPLPLSINQLLTQKCKNGIICIHECIHEWINDYIDICPESSQQICYCIKCEVTKG